MTTQPSFLTFDDDELTLISNLIHDRITSVAEPVPGDAATSFYVALQEKIETDLLNRGVIDLTPIDY